MAGNPFVPDFESLPRVIPVFPLTGVLLLPRGRLPLNIFEGRYLAMTRAALAEPCRVIGMVQPRTPDPDDNRGMARMAEGGDPELYGIGCAGRITSFAETDDGRYVLTLTGLARFAITEEMAPVDGYRRVQADYHRFRDDLAADDVGAVDRDALIATARRFFDQQGAAVNWDGIEGADTESLVTSFAMSIPFGPNERQALLEAKGTAERAELIATLLEMALAEAGGPSGVTH